MPPRKRNVNRPSAPRTAPVAQVSNTDIPEFDTDDDAPQNDVTAVVDDADDTADVEDNDDTDDEGSDDSSDEDEPDSPSELPHPVQHANRPWEQEPGAPRDGIIIGPGELLNIEGIVRNNMVTVTKTVYRALKQVNSHRWQFFLLHHLNAQVPVKNVNKVIEPSK